MPQRLSTKLLRELEILRSIGMAITSLGNEYRFDLVQPSVKLYWKAILHQEINFESKNIAFVGTDKIAELLEQKADREFAQIHHLLPRKVRGQYTVSDLKRVYGQSVGGIMGFMRGLDSVSVGHYDNVTDVCYIAEPYPSQGERYPAQILTVVHELAHRWLHHQRIANPLLADGKWLNDGGTEEQFCRRLEGSYGSYLFSNNPKIRTIGDVNASRSLLLPLLEELVDPHQIKRRTKGAVKYYTVLLEQTPS